MQDSTEKARWSASETLHPPAMLFVLSKAHPLYSSAVATTTAAKRRLQTIHPRNIQRMSRDFAVDNMIQEIPSTATSPLTPPREPDSIPSVAFDIPLFFLY
jgi:hypothetical protein